MKKNNKTQTLTKLEKEYKKAAARYKEATAKQSIAFKEFKKAADHLERMDIACDKAAARLDRISMQLWDKV